MNFNDSQMSAIRHGDGPMLVIAGPGSGKTTVLTMRIKYLIEEYKVNPEEILVITFTKAAAEEMRSRFEKLSGGKRGVTFGTFHAVFFYILKAAYNFSVNNIIKEDEKNYILKELIEKSSLETEDINDTLNNISGEISRVKTEGIDIDSYYSAAFPEEEFRRIYKGYDSTLRGRRLIDFDDMLLYCYELFVKRPDILKRWQKKYTYILVDEFQDINKIQYDVVKMLAKPQNNIFVVGDDDQSIYGFRGSKPEIMLNFEKDYTDCKKTVLDINYRSSSNITTAAGLVIQNNKIRFSKTVISVNPPGDKVNIVEFNTTGEEYKRIVSDIRKSVQNGKKYRNHAVLYRTNSGAGSFIRCMIENNIPFVLRDGVPNMFEHWIAVDFLTYMDIAMGSRKRRDFIRIMNKPKRYIGRDYLTDSEISLDELEKYYEDKPWMIERLERM
ncbi:MAG: ATP-dependent helicase, partial [Butyrivibrio sp.]